MRKTYYLSMDSFTTAMKGYRLLTRMGIDVRIERINPSFSMRGCGYSLVLHTNPKKAIDFLKQYNIKVTSLYER